MFTACDQLYFYGMNFGIDSTSHFLVEHIQTKLCVKATGDPPTHTSAAAVVSMMEW